MHRFKLGLVLLAALSSLSLFNQPDDAPRRMARAAAAFLKTLPEPTVKKVQLPFDGPHRRAWHFVPKSRKGVSFRDMSTVQKSAAHALLRSVLSSSGYLKATGIMALEGALQALGQSADRYAPDLYWITIYGEPSLTRSWGWRLEGHHLSLNFTSVVTKGGVSLAVTPSFLGAQPAEIEEGADIGLKVLSQEEALARQLMASMDKAAKERAVISKQAPSDILMSPARKKWIEEPVGLPMSAMTLGQHWILKRLIGEFAENLKPDLAEQQLTRMLVDEAAVHFAWAGSLKKREGHYYRIQGRSFIIEYHNVQQNANHIHTIWRDRERDFGDDLLLEHIREHHQKGQKK